MPVKKGNIPWNKGIHTGIAPWNKGKHPEYVQGKNHPMFGSHNVGDKAAHWKGGRIKHQRGYVLIFSPEHPFRTKDGYVFEHRLVMEKYIGRHLLPSEVVHHKNKILDDNQIVNLELFPSQQQHLNYHKHEREVSFV